MKGNASTTIDVKMTTNVCVAAVEARALDQPNTTAQTTTTPPKIKTRGSGTSRSIGERTVSITRTVAWVEPTRLAHRRRTAHDAAPARGKTLRPGRRRRVDRRARGGPAGALRRSLVRLADGVRGKGSVLLPTVP